MPSQESILQSISKELHDLNGNIKKLIDLEKEKVMRQTVTTVIDGEVVAEGIGKSIQSSVNSF